MRPKRLIVYHYNDYRVYLRDFFDYKKREDPSFTQRAFAQRACFSAHSFCTFLIQGKRNLSDEGARKLCAAMGLDENESTFFQLLVLYNQSVATDERDRIFRQLNLVRRNSTFYRINKKQYAYFDQWYYPAIRELAVHADWGADYARLGRMLDPPINAAQARRAIRTLDAIGLIRKNADGTWAQSAETVIGENLPPHLVKKARNTYFRMAIDASENIGPDARNLSCATIALSKESYEKLSQMLDAVHEQAVALSARDTRPDKVYQLNLQLFPLSCGMVRSENEGGDDE